MDKKSGSLLLFFLGAAAGAAITYYLTSEEGKALVEELKKKGKSVKDEVNAEMEKGTTLLKDLLNTLKANANGL